MNKRLRSLVEKCKIDTKDKNVHFHLFRKFLYSRLRRQDRDMAKVIVGKSASLSDMTYEELAEQTEKTFKLAYPSITVNGNALETKQKQTREISQLKSAIGSLQKDLTDMRIREAFATERVTKLEKMINIDPRKAMQLVEIFERILEDVKKKHPKAYKQALDELEDEQQTNSNSS